MRTRAVPAVSPGEMLEEELLKPLGLRKYRLAKDFGVSAQRIGDIVAGKRAITANTAIARESMGEALARISRCELLTS